MVLPKIRIPIPLSYGFKIPILVSSKTFPNFYSKSSEYCMYDIIMKLLILLSLSLSPFFLSLSSKRTKKEVDLCSLFSASFTANNLEHSLKKPLISGPNTSEKGIMKEPTFECLITLFLIPITKIPHFQTSYLPNFSKSKGSKCKAHNKR